MPGAESDPSAWLRKAERDLELAETIAETFTDHASFCIQQAVEKALKAVIVFRNERPPHVHSLSVLRDLVGADLVWTAEPAWLERVSRWVAVSRYPTSAEGFKTLDVETVKAAILIARVLLTEVAAKLA